MSIAGDYSSHGGLRSLKWGDGVTVNAHALSKKGLLDSDFYNEMRFTVSAYDSYSTSLWSFLHCNSSGIRQVLGLGWTYEASAYHQPGNQLIAVLRIQH